MKNTTGENLGITCQSIGPSLIATTRRIVKDRQELLDVLQELTRRIPARVISGNMFCIFNFVTHVVGAFDVEVGCPVNRPITLYDITTRLLPATEVLSLIHRDSPELIGKSYAMLFNFAATRGIISDEFCREIYPAGIASLKESLEIELQLMVHDWPRLFARNLQLVLGEAEAAEIVSGCECLTVDSTLDDRFRWLIGALTRFNTRANEHQRAEVLTKCAHVFPPFQISRLREVYLAVKASTGEPWRAVDAVIDFMEKDPCWQDRPRREGAVIYSTKKPRDAAAYQKAEDAMARRQAYCYCPLIRHSLHEEIPLSFCYCGAGWYRQQWEGIIGSPVSVEIHQSLLKGDEVCEFALRLSPLA
jgi:effector-binding domain-containing protein